MKSEQLEYYFQKYYSLIFRVAFTQVKSHADAEDIMQEVFVKVLRYQPVFESDDHEKAWMIRTTLNLCRDFHKNKWNQATMGMENIREEEKTYMKVPYLEQDDTLWAVLSLEEKYSQPLYLFYYEDYAVKEIAEVLSVPENTVKTNLRRGREALKAVLVKEK